MTPDNKPAAPGLVERDDFDKLSADLTRAKNLLVRLWDKHPAARSQIEACTGTWFAWGTDRDAALSQPVPSAPIDMVLHCPKCGEQHIDWAEPAVEHDHGAIEFVAWDNPPHRSHLCHNCGHIWRPADVPTNGVAAVKTKGKEDSPIAVPAAAPAVEPVAWRWSPSYYAHLPGLRKDWQDMPPPPGNRKPGEIEYAFAAAQVAPAIEPFAWYVMDADPDSGPSIEFYCTRPDDDARPLFTGPTHGRPLAWLNTRGTDPVSNEFRHRSAQHRSGWPIPLYATLPASPEPANQGATKPVHTDHPFQHWDRTCPACVLEASPPVPEPLTPAAGEPKP